MSILGISLLLYIVIVPTDYDCLFYIFRLYSTIHDECVRSTLSKPSGLLALKTQKPKSFEEIFYKLFYHQSETINCMLPAQCQIGPKAASRII